MTENKALIFRGLMIISLLVPLTIASNLSAAQSMPAAPAETITLDALAATTVTLTATQDAYTDISFETTNFDEGALNAANSPGPPEEPDVTTKKIFVAFDLSGVDVPIKRATLRLSTLTCGGKVPVDAVNVTVYGVDNSMDWSEDTLTWATQPVTSTGVLADLDAGATVFDRSQTYTWTDDNQGAFATWLEAQRGANDGSATLMLVIDNADDPGMADVFFEDREGTGAAYGCTDSLGGPTLEVSNRVGDHLVFLPLVAREWLGDSGLAARDSATAATYTVCASGCAYSSIQAAIDGAANGDTLDLAGETFTETLTINKSLTILGTDRDDTIIQAANAPEIANSRVITVSAGVTVTIENVIIRYGDAGWGVPGGGIYTEGTLTLTHSTIMSNTAFHEGGGLYCQAGNLTLDDVIVSGNSATSGGGLFLDGDSPGACHYPSLNNVTFVRNSVTGQGGGIKDVNAHPRLTNVTFFRNAANSGGGMFISDDDPAPILENVNFIENLASGLGLSSGGGVFNDDSNSIFRGVNFYGNESTGSGGGIHNSASAIDLTNAVFSGNAARWGGGIYNTTVSDPTITNVTIVSNTAEVSGGGISNTNSDPSLTNVIVWGNTAVLSGDNFDSDISSTMYISYSDVEGCNGSGAAWNADCGVDEGNNIDADPIFVRIPDPGDGDWTTLGDNDYGDLHLQFGSPAINTGTNAGCPATDLDGVPRPQGPQCDMGAYEFGAANLCVVGGATAASHSTIQAAVFRGCEEIYILPGRYPEADISLDHSVELLGVGDMSVTISGDGPGSIFSISPGVTVTIKNLSILDGRLFNTPQCIYNQGTLILEDARISDCSTRYDGGGIYNEGDLELDNVEMYYNSANDGGAIYCAAGSSATISNSRIFINFASGRGGGIYAQDATRILIENSQFIENHADASGGGLGLRDVDECVITDSEIDWNWADVLGGGIYVYGDGDPLTIENTRVTNNTAVNKGGGMYAVGNLAMTNNAFIDNYAQGGGGGVYLARDSMGPVPTGMITATTFSENSAPLGAGIYTGYQGYQTQIVDSTIISNTAGDSGGGLYIDGQGGATRPTTGVTITHSIIQDNTAANTGGGIATRDQNPGDIYLRIRTSTIENNTAATGGGVYSNNSNASFYDVQFDIKYSTIRDNRSTGGDGGGIYFHTEDANDTLELNSSTINDNSATEDGGGVVVDGGTFTSINSTYSWNVATDNGGGLVVAAGSGTSADLKSLTITRNSADNDQDDVGDGGGLYRQFASGAVTVTASIVAGNRDRSPTGDVATDCDGNFTSGNYNVIGDNTSCNTWLPTDRDGWPGNLADPMLLPLADNGGPTWTHEPDPNSPVLDFNTSAHCPNKDQRGLQRPQGAACDTGAFELGTCDPPVAPTLSIARDGQNVLLTWNEDSANREYVVARVTDYILQTDLFTTTVQEGRYTDYGAIGDPENNYVYIVRGENACGDRSPLSNMVSEFDFQIYDAATSQAPLGASGRSLHYVIFTIPLTGTTVPTNTESLAAYIDPHGSVKGVGKWDVQNQVWIRRYVGSHIGTAPFLVYPGDVLAIGVDDTAPETFAFIGDIPASGSIQNALTQGVYNAIIVPLDQSGALTMDADGLAAAIGGVDRVAVWSPFEQRWYIRNTSSSGPNFDIQLGMPYAIRTDNTAPPAWP